jgi:hypothetical protein
MASTADFGQFTRNYPFVDETSYDVQETIYENGTKQFRLINEQEDIIFVLNFYPLTRVESQNILDFFKARQGKTEAFKFTNPLDGRIYDVRFAENKLSRERVAYDTFRIRISLENAFPFGAYNQINVSDTISLTEHLSSFYLTNLLPFVYDGVSIVESATLWDIIIELGVLYEEITVTEFASLLDLIIELETVYDEIAINEEISLLLDILYSTMNDVVSISEDINVLVLIDFSVYDSFSINEYINMLDLAHNVAVEDSITSLEDVSLYIQIESFMYEEIGAIESVELFDFIRRIDVYENIALNILGFDAFLEVILNLDFYSVIIINEDVTIEVV